MGFKIGWLTWEQRKLGEMANVTKLAGFEFTKYVNYSKEGKIIALRGLNVKNGELNLEDVKYIDNSDFSKLNRSKLYKNDILFTYVGTVGQLAIINQDNKYYLAPNVSRIRIQDTNNPNFIAQEMSSKSFYNRRIFPLIATSSQPALSMKGIRKFIISITSIEEQDLIASLFQRINLTIALQQRKLDQLNTLKKGLLQKMFADKKHPKPELRFKGFSDDWEQCKFEQILISHPYKKYLASPSTNGKYKVIQQGDNPVVGWASGNPFMQYEGATLFGDHTLSLYKPTAPFFVATDGLKILTGKNIKGYYLFTLLEKNKPKSQGYKRHFNILKNEKVVITKNPEEQQQMGCLFKQVDKTITLQQSKLDKLNSLKKSLLQNMFI